MLHATFDIARWEEIPIQEWEGGKLTRASIVKRYSGDIEGEAVQEYLMSYGPDGGASFVGIERMDGTAGGRSGVLVLREVGRFTGGAARATVTVVGGSGALEGASGTGEMVADPAGRISLGLVTT